MKIITGIVVALMVLLGILFAQDNVKTAVKTENKVVALDKNNYPINGIHKTLNLACTDCHLEKNESDYSSAMSTSCFNCHGSYEKLKEATGHLGHNNNIHAAPHFGSLDCDMCHKAHKPTVNFCVSCHGQETMKSLIVK